MATSKPHTAGTLLRECADCGASMGTYRTALNRANVCLSCACATEDR